MDQPTHYAEIVDDQVMVDGLFLHHRRAGDPPLELKKKFKDLLEDEATAAAVDDDLITKIFSQTIQVSPSDEDSPQAPTNCNNATSITGTVLQQQQPSPALIPGEIIIHPPDDDDEDEDDDYDDVSSRNNGKAHEGVAAAATNGHSIVDKVPTDFRHFNETICDSDENEEEDDDNVEVAAVTEYLNGHSNNNDDHQHQQSCDEQPLAGTELVSDQEQAEIRDFEQMERLVALQADQQQQKQPAIDHQSADENLMRSIDCEENIDDQEPLSDYDNSHHGGHCTEEVHREHVAIREEEEDEEEYDEEGDIDRDSYAQNNSGDGRGGCAQQTGPDTDDCHVTANSMDCTAAAGAPANSATEDAVRMSADATTASNSTRTISSRKTRTTTSSSTTSSTKVMTTSSAKSMDCSSTITRDITNMVQGGGGGVEETAVIIADEKRTLKKEASKKTKKVKKGEKENISVCREENGETTTNGGGTDELLEPSSALYHSISNGRDNRINTSSKEQVADNNLGQQQLGIFTSVRELSKLYQENCMARRNACGERTTPKEELLHVKLSVKTMCRSFLDLISLASSQKDATKCSTNGPSFSTPAATYYSSPNAAASASGQLSSRWPPRKLFQKSKSISDLRSSLRIKPGTNHSYHPPLPASLAPFHHQSTHNLRNGIAGGGSGDGGGYGGYSNGSVVGSGGFGGHQQQQHHAAEVSRISRHFSRSAFFLKKLLFFENWRRCNNTNNNDPSAAPGFCEHNYCPHCGRARLPGGGSGAGSNGQNKGSSNGYYRNGMVSSLRPPNKIRISVMQFDMKSSFSKFDALQKKAAAAAAQQHSVGAAVTPVTMIRGDQESIVCTGCGKVVYQMEQIKAENRYWHRNCFRCTTCQKPLSVDTYQSHEAVLYCKPHFKQLFSPKTVIDDETDDPNQKKGRPEMIIRENQPEALPDGVIRATDKVEDGFSLDDLHRLKNVKHAFQVFEKGVETTTTTTTLTESHKVEKSPSILNKLAHFQSKMDKRSRKAAARKGVVTATDLNGEPLADNLSGSSSCCASSDDEDQEDGHDDDGEPPEGVDADLWRSRRAIRESESIPHCTDLDDLKRKFEDNSAETERRDRQKERQEEIKRIRSRLFMGKQARIKEQYQQAVMDSEFVPTAGSGSDLDVANRRRTADETGSVVAAGNIREKMQQLNEGGCAAVDASEAGGGGLAPTTKQKLLEMKSQNQLELQELRRQKTDNQEIKSKFEGGGVEKSPSYRIDDPDMLAQMENGIAKTSRNLFLEIDKQIQQSGPISPLLQPQSQLRKSNSQLIKNIPSQNSADGEAPPEVILSKSGDENIVIDTKDLQKKFEFFEKYKEQDHRSPKRATNTMVTKFKDTSAVKEMFENTGTHSEVARQESQDEGQSVARESHTTKKMLNIFREIESGADKRPHNDGPRPLKAFTPPPDGGRRLYDNGDGPQGNNHQDGGADEEEEEEDEEGGVTDNSDIESEDEEELKKRIGGTRYDDEVLQQAKQEARAQKLRAKFERWESEQIKLEQQAAAGRRPYLDDLRQSNGAAADHQHQQQISADQQTTNGDAIDGNQLESAKNLREKFEFMAKGDTNQSVTSPRKVLVNRFV